MLDAERTRAIQKPVHCRAVERPRASETIRASESSEQLQVYLLRETTEGAIADVGRFVEHARLQVLRDEADDLPAHVEAVDRVDVQPIEQRLGRLDAGLLVIERADAAIDEGGRRRLSQVVAHGAEHDRNQPRATEIAVRPPCFVDDHQRVDPDVAFGVPFRLLFAADEWTHLREHAIDDAKVERQHEPE